MMGLSSYGSPKYYDLIIDKIFKEKEQIKLNLKYFNHSNVNFSYKFEGQPNQNNLIAMNLRNFLMLKI